MNKREFYATAKRIAETDPRWIERLISAAMAGDVYLRPLHIQLLRLALRKRTT